MEKFWVYFYVESILLWEKRLKESRELMFLMEGFGRGFEIKLKVDGVILEDSWEVGRKV